MRSLARAVRNRGFEGEPIPMPIKALRDLNFVMRRGQLSLFAAGPGVGKSIVALNLTVLSEIPALFVSADTDRSDQADRAAALLSGVPKELMSEDEFFGALSRLRKDLRFEFDSSPTAADIMQMCTAYSMVFGIYPSLIIVDTLSKVWSDAGDENARNKDAVDRCQEVARITGAHVAVLHHATKGFDSGDKPIPLDGLMSGVSKLPEQIVTMHREGEDRVCFTVVKNRSGKADPTANHCRAFARLNFDLMRVEELVSPVYDWADDPELASV